MFVYQDKKWILQTWREELIGPHQLPLPVSTCPKNDLRKPPNLGLAGLYVYTLFICVHVFM